MRRRSHSCLTLSLLCTAACFAPAAWAAETDTPEGENPLQQLVDNFKQEAKDDARSDELQELVNSLNDQRKELEKQQESLRQQLQELNSYRNEIAKQQMQLQELETKLQAMEPEAPLPTPESIAANTEQPEEVGLNRRSEDQKKQPEVDALAEQGGVLSPRGRLTLEPSIEYSNSSATRVAIEGFTIIPALNVGSFEISEVDRDTLITALSMSYGVTNRLEVNAKVPFVSRSDSTLSRPIGTGASQNSLSSVDGSGIGDVEFGASYQLTDGLGGWPYLVGNLRVKTATGTDPFSLPIDPNTGLQQELPTGSGFYAIQPSITAIAPSDPVVFFGNLGYLYNMKKNIGGTYGEIDPGDSISASVGMGFSLNKKASFSIGYSHAVVFETTQNGTSLPTSDTLQIGSLNLGYSYKLDENQSISFSVSSGLTDDAPDVRVLLRYPIAFNL